VRTGRFRIGIEIIGEFAVANTILQTSHHLNYSLTDITDITAKEIPHAQRNH
jgi:hypothetical protein